ncbi:MAG: hypothetical protein KDA91_08125 [Planctomycetaceae bacterium]|nr:hypothetical protein [Planctomycetaceae bacterium]
MNQGQYQAPSGSIARDDVPLHLPQQPPRDELVQQLLLRQTQQKAEPVRLAFWGLVCVAAVLIGGRTLFEMRMAAMDTAVPKTATLPSEGREVSGTAAELMNAGSAVRSGSEVRTPARESIDAVPAQKAGLVTSVMNRILGRTDSAVSEPPSQQILIEGPAPHYHASPLHEAMVTPGNFMYLGAFRAPHVDENREASRFCYGGWTLAYNPDGDPSGSSDGFAGSLFISSDPTQELIAEISIPQPVTAKPRFLDAIPAANILQSFGDPTGGIRGSMTGDSSEPFRYGGLHVIDGRLHWTMYKYYNVETIDFPSHGVSTLDLNRPEPQGPWHLGPSETGRSEWHSYKHAGYILRVPDDYANQWFYGHKLISGLQIATGLNIASHGPSLFAYSLPTVATSPGRSLDALPLMYNDISRPARDFNPADRWTGGAWLRLGEKNTIIISGRKALGEVYYGEARPGDCTIDKGYHGAPYESQIRFYAPQALVAASRHSLDPTGIEPWYIWDGNSPGGGPAQYLFPSCTQYLGGIACDPEHNLLYLVQIDGGATSDREFDPLPVIHVFRYGEPAL